MGEPRRNDRVAEAIREGVATFLADGAKDPRIRGLITVTAVDVTRDLRHATVFVSVMGSDSDWAASGRDSEWDAYCTSDSSALLIVLIPSGALASSTRNAVK